MKTKKERKRERWYLDVVERIVVHDAGGLHAAAAAAHLVLSWHIQRARARASSSSRLIAISVKAPRPTAAKHRTNITTVKARTAMAARGVLFARARLLLSALIHPLSFG